MVPSVRGLRTVDLNDAPESPVFQTGIIAGLQAVSQLPLTVAILATIEDSAIAVCCHKVFDLVVHVCHVLGVELGFAKCLRRSSYVSNWGSSHWLLCYGVSRHCFCQSSDSCCLLFNCFKQLLIAGSRRHFSDLLLVTFSSKAR